MACIFCDKSPLTKEHVWADWLTPYIDTNMSEYSVLRAKAHVDRSDFETSVRGGDIHSWQVRCVCADCNNGWMSQLQTEAKPIVLRLLKGESFVLSDKMQCAMAAWAAMAVMAGDAADRQSPAVQDSDRKFFRQNKAPPLNWRIVIGDFERSDWRAHWVRNPLQIEDRLEPGTDRTATKLNAQFTTFVTGRLLVNASVAPPGNKYLNISFPDEVNRKVRQIWPISCTEISWPPVAMTDGDADIVAHSGIQRAMKVGRDLLAGNASGF